MPPQRNKIAQLPLEKRLLVMQALADGSTANAVRELLRESGVAEEQLPGDNAFTAYRDSEEFREFKSGLAEEMMQWKRGAEKKKMLAEALSIGGGVGGLLDLAIYEAAEELRGCLKNVEDGANLAKVANALRGLRAVAMQQAKVDHASRVTALEAEIAALRSTQGGTKGVTEETLKDAEGRLKLL